MIDKTEVAGYSVSGVTAILTTIQDNPEAQLILFIGNIILLALTIIYTLFKVFSVIKEARTDGKITQQEKEKIKHTFKEGFLNILSKIKGVFKKEDKDNGKHKENQSNDRDITSKD